MFAVGRYRLSHATHRNAEEVEPDDSSNHGRAGWRRRDCAGSMTGIPGARMMPAMSDRPVALMKRILHVIALAWCLPAPALADFESGCTAFERGDYEAARREWEPLVQQGHAPAQFRLGCLYTFGQGVPEDHAMALRLYRMAAEQGEADAQNNLGGLYAEGLGVEADLVQAYMWFALAGAAGHEMAARNRAYLADGMTAAQIAAAEALAEDWRARHR
jgi:hypothetical protein